MHPKALQEMQKTIAMLFDMANDKFQCKPTITLQEACSGAWSDKPDLVLYKPDIVYIMGDIEVMIVLGKECRDQVTGSTFLDAYILPLLWDRPRPLVGQEPAGFHHPEIYTHDISEEESDLWRQALPTFIDKARKTWQHDPCCEYQTDGVSTRSIHVIDFSDEYIHCSCGEGKDLAGLPKQRECDSQRSTRAVIPLPSELPHLEHVCH
jgi:hypothetical protein